MDLPTRVHRRHEAECEYGQDAARLLPQLLRSDDLADAAVASLDALDPAAAEVLLNRGVKQGPDAVQEAPEALRVCLADAWTVPEWVDEGACDAAGRLLFRSGVLGGMVLGTKSLVLGYASPGGNKPLALSGRLSRPEYAGKRLAETAKFVSAVSEPGGMRPGALGHQITLRVRLMHARVRALVLRGGQWRTEDWGHPINQHDMLATILVFSAAFIEGIGQLGVEVSTDEADAYTHLWNRVGQVIGVQPELLPSDASRALRSAQLIDRTQGPPDDDARALVKSYFEAPLLTARTPGERRQARVRVAMGQAMAKYLLGEELATQLDLQSARGAAVPAIVSSFVGGAECLRRMSPRADDWAVKRGREHWAQAVQLGLAGGVADFVLPQQLLGRLQAA